MARSLTLAAALLSLAGCAGEAERAYVVRIDLDRTAADTAHRDTSPGFTELRGQG